MRDAGRRRIAGCDVVFASALREPRVFWALFLVVSEWPIGNGQCQSVSQLFHGPAPPRAHPSTGSQSGQCLA